MTAENGSPYMKVVSILMVFLMACSPTFRYVTKRCPTTVLKAADIVLGFGALAVSGIKWAADKPYTSIGYSAVGLGTLAGAHFGEDKCSR